MRKGFWLVMIVLAACGNDGTADPTEAMVEAFIESCPVTDATSVSERDACAEALTKNPVLQKAFADVVLWGGQPAGFGPEELLTEASLTEFAPRVLRRMYLSTFMYEDKPARIEQQGDYQIVHMPVRFRNKLGAGEYPYPFWHSQNKWTSYEYSTDVMFVLKNGKVIVAVRSENQDKTRPHEDRTFDGMWRWNNGAEPRVALYSYMFSPNNPHVERLDAAYRALEEGFRESTCITCHDPTNSSGMRHLELLSYPNQALSGRHDLMKQLSLNVMPPASMDMTAGIQDETMRSALMQMAQEFSAAGDAAMAFEGE